MGIDVHALNFLRYANKKGAFGKTITMARQGLHVIESYVRDQYFRSVIKALASTNDDKYCEPLLLNYFGATTVDSIDKSDYEQASIVHDMNLPVPTALRGSYDTVIDAGTAEHIYNIPAALENFSSLCKPGGQILHILPANNFCGHGFWQFSPELFFSLYSQENGYSETEVFLANVANIGKWYKVRKPQDGKRVIVHSSNRLHALVRTVVSHEGYAHKDVQQSDYVSKWAGESADENDVHSLSTPRRALQMMKKSQSKFVSALIAPAYHSYYRLRPAPTKRLNSLNPGLVKLDVASLLLDR